MKRTYSDETSLTHLLSDYDLLSKLPEDDHPFFIDLILSVETPLLDLSLIRDLITLGECESDAPLFFILILMFSNLSKGSLCMGLTQDDISVMVPHCHKKHAISLLHQFCDRLENQTYDLLISTSPDAGTPMILSILKDHSLLYFQRYYGHERHLKKQIESLVEKSDTPLSDEEQAAKLLATLFSSKLVLRAGADKTPLAKDPIQEKAVKLALSKRFTTISGGPGTGKTSLMVTLLRCFVRCGIPADKIILCAPTGRAAKRMSDALREGILSIETPEPHDIDLLSVSGSTLHKTLSYSRQADRFYHNQINPLNADVVIVDEVSMIDLVLLDHFLKAVPEKCRVVFLGDKDQLPSVDAGAVLAEMIPAEKKISPLFKDNAIVLQTVYRSGITLSAIAKEINNGNAVDLPENTFGQAIQKADDTFSFVPVSKNLEKKELGTVFQQLLHDWGTHYFLTPLAGYKLSYKELVKSLSGKVPLMPETAQLTDAMKSLLQYNNLFRILTVTKKGLFGAYGINRYLCDLVAVTISGRPKFGHYTIGQCVMATVNDYRLGLFNGDTGVILFSNTGTLCAFFPDETGYKAYPVSRLSGIEPAFAITVHKSQGSEIDDVLLVLPEDPDHILLTREILYTGITRARKKIICHGNSKAFHSACKKTIKRRSGLSWQ